MKQLSEITVGFIGFGNMAGAIAKGLIRQGTLRPDQICACAKNWDKLCANTEKAGMLPRKDAAEVAFASDVVFVAVKPYLVREVLEPIRELLPGKILVSVAAGCLFDWYEEFLDVDKRQGCCGAWPFCPLACFTSMTEAKSQRAAS